MTLKLGCSNSLYSFIHISDWHFQISHNALIGPYCNCRYLINLLQHWVGERIIAMFIFANMLQKALAQWLVLKKAFDATPQIKRSRRPRYSRVFFSYL